MPKAHYPAMTLAEDLNACPTVGDDPPVRVVPEELCQRIAAALVEVEEFVRIRRVGYDGPIVGGK